MAINCACCGIDMIGEPGDVCDGCLFGTRDGSGNGCNRAITWHCFTGHCDGSGCTYEGECEQD